MGSFGVVPDLAMIMRQHAPKSKQAGGRDVKAKLRDIPFQKCRDEIPPPGKAVLFGSSQEGKWETATLPVLLLRGKAHFFEAEAAHGDNRQTPGQGFGGLVQQI